MLRDLKVWADQFERDIARAQVAETSLQEKYQVSSKEVMYDKFFLSSLCVKGTIVFCAVCIYKSHYCVVQRNKDTKYFACY